LFFESNLTAVVLCCGAHASASVSLSSTLHCSVGPPISDPRLPLSRRRPPERAAARLVPAAHRLSVGSGPSPTLHRSMASSPPSPLPCLTPPPLQKAPAAAPPRSLFPRSLLHTATRAALPSFPASSPSCLCRSELPPTAFPSRLRHLHPPPVSAASVAAFHYPARPSLSSLSPVATGSRCAPPLRLPDPTTTSEHRRAAAPPLLLTHWCPWGTSCHRLAATEPSVSTSLRTQTLRWHASRFSAGPGRQAKVVTSPPA
jgi:hypothetical protein